MIEPHLRLQKPLEDYVEFWNSLNRRSVPLLSSFVVPGFSFSDPYHCVIGASDVANLFIGRFQICDRASYRVQDFMWGRCENTAYMHWHFHYNPKSRFFEKKADEIMIAGMSRLTFLPDGVLLAQDDYFSLPNGRELKAYKAL